MINKRRIAASAAVIVTLFASASFARAQSWSDLAEPSEDVKAPPPNLAGEWTGSAVDAKFGVKDLKFEITQKKSQISGTWDIGILSGTIANGSVNGKKETVAFKLKFDDQCAPKLTAKLSDDNTTMSGRYHESTKHCHSSGTFNASLVP